MNMINAAKQCCQTVTMHCQTLVSMATYLMSLHHVAPPKRLDLFIKAESVDVGW